MDNLIISGGLPLNGNVRISGAKNAGLPCLVASLLSSEPLRVSNIPHLQDVTTTLDLLSRLGAKVELQEGMTVVVDSSNVANFRANYDIVQTMRASVLVLGPLLARFGHAEVYMPGGCAIGSRPINLHLGGLKAMGADIELEGGYIRATADRLHGAHIFMDISSVTGTENLMMAACLAKGTSVIDNAAMEPEVVDLAECLIGMGAKIEGAGSSRIKIEGTDSLKEHTHHLIADRIEAGTYLVAGAVTGGNITVLDVQPENLLSVIDKLQDAGAEMAVGEDYIQLSMNGRRPSAVNVRTAPFPGFPTDMQAQIMMMNCIADGTGSVTETIFENRFQHVQEFIRMGADISTSGSTVSVNGVPRLQGARVTATDLRASASLVLAGLAAESQTIIERIHHIDRGYHCIEEKLALLGAQIRRVHENGISRDHSDADAEQVSTS
ncbi:MAG: UDP-N-acetylglucosamine 1-carboxyvinyltransferase [Acidiferrobacterales bacterium]|nr:UDP-N-acetylglucosamine 1-carboxyvinyltransferase [Acidiferrobacterales bacterium]